MFLGWVMLISISGAVAPGPVLAATVARGLTDGTAGLKISIGHALVEVPLIAAIALGLTAVLQDDGVLAVIGLVGGAVLLYMGASMLRPPGEVAENGSRYGSLTAGVALTAANPYFLLWWATVGAALIALAAAFGWWMIPLFTAAHLACDFLWLGIVSYSASRSRRFAKGRWFTALNVVFGLFLVGFALYFLYGSLTTLL